MLFEPSVHSHTFITSVQSPLLPHGGDRFEIAVVNGKPGDFSGGNPGVNLLAVELHI